MLAAILTFCGASVFTSCVSNDDNPTPSQPEGDGDVVMPVDPTTDQMEVNVTADLLTASISNFDDNSMASALLKRIPVSVADVNSNTRFVLLKGDDLFNVTNETWKAIAMVYLKGGFVAIERPTNERLLGFTVGLMVAVQITLEELLGDDGGAAARAMTADLQRRISNAGTLTRGAAEDDDDPLAPGKVSMEMMILSPYGIYSQTAFNKEQKVTITITDEDGTETQNETIIENKLDGYHYGLLADGAAAWLNEKANSDEDSPAAARALTRADAQKAINEAMTCSDEFTISHPLNVVDLDGTTRSFDNKGTTVIKAWSIHDFEKDQDYYYVQEKSHLALGGKNANPSKTLYWGPYETYNWHKIKSDVKIDGRSVSESYGAWMSGTNHSLTLKGSGTIDVVSSASNPAAGKEPSTQSVPVTSDPANWSLGIPAATDIKGGFGWGYSSSSGSSYTSAFSMTNSTISDAPESLEFRDKITDSQVAFTYKQAESNGAGDKLHWLAPDVMTNDFDVTNTVCWRVSNPSEQYSLDVAAHHSMITLFSGKRYTVKYHMRVRGTTHVSGSFTLKQPCRYLEKWYCQINAEGENMAADASAKLRSHLQETIDPVAFQESFNTGETKKGETTTMANGITYIKSLMERNRKAIDDFVLEQGIEHYEIKWYTDDATTGTYSIGADIRNLQTLTSDVIVQDGDVLTGTLDNDVKISIADGATVTLKGVTIDSYYPGDYEWAGLTCQGNATIILAKGTTNTVKGFNEKYPGIFVPFGKTLTIQGSGTLDASSNGKGAGIGGGSGWEFNCGNIIINDGIINATGGTGAAGIGSGQSAECGYITISGGSVTATGGEGAAGIGSGNDQASCGNITISGSSVTATGGDEAAGIGSGKNSACKDITIANTVGFMKVTKGSGATYSIGAGNIGTQGTVTVFGVEGAVSTSPYTYISGFTINGSGTQVRFSPGNLQATYDGSSWTWHFAEHQWDYIGNKPGNTTVAFLSPWISGTGTVDLFGWSTDKTNVYIGKGLNGVYFNNYYGINNSTDNYTVDCGNFIDWGTLEISGYAANTWRTLSHEEWQYLFNGRTNASQKYAQATVNGIHGLVVLPDGWELPAGCKFIAGMNDWGTNVYDATQWASMEANGAVFLPAAGKRHGTSYLFEDNGFYWSSTHIGDAGWIEAYLFSFPIGLVRSIMYEGYSVRLVR